MKLTRNELEQIFGKIIKYLENEEIEDISFTGTDNFYLKIWHKDIDFDNEEFMKCPNYTIGSLSDDIEDLKKVLTGKFKLTELDLEKLGAILTALGATM